MGFCCSELEEDGTIVDTSTPSFKINSSIVNQEDVAKATAYKISERRMELAE